MLKRIYADNFKCLVNFEWELGSARINLMLGPNGSGKTTVFDCLEALRAFANGDGELDDLFPASTLTRWQDVPTQSFEIDWELEGGVYRYEVAIGHNESRTHRQVAHERLSFDGKSLLSFENGEVQLEVQLWGEGMSGQPQVYPFNSRQSAMAFLPTPVATNMNTIRSLPRSPTLLHINRFRAAFGRTTILQIIPPMMDETSIKESQRPLRYFQNFVSWYRWISQDQGVAISLQKELKEILPGFSHFKFEAYGPEARLLKAVFNQKGGNQIALTLSGLSDGQRMLVALYALLQGLSGQPEGLNGAEDQPGTLLCLDEPDNFVASGEIQPWLTAAEEQLSNTKTRMLMISHHPESINYGLMPSSEEIYSVFWFSREENSHTRVQPVAPEQPGGLKPSELAARGWLKP
jgi:energy-coupling factor transporter ATP-binding protein EcfA2